MGANANNEKTKENEVFRKIKCHELGGLEPETHCMPTPRTNRMSHGRDDEFPVQRL